MMTQFSKLGTDSGLGALMGRWSRVLSAFGGNRVDQDSSSDLAPIQQNGFLSLRERIRQEGPGEGVVYVPWLDWIQEKQSAVH